VQIARALATRRAELAREFTAAIRARRRLSSLQHAAILRGGLTAVRWISEREFDFDDQSAICPIPRADRAATGGNSPLRDRKARS
jgi:hypothetical protein